MQGNSKGSDNPANPLYSERVEDKYILPLESLNRVVEEIESHLKPFYPAKSTDYNQQESIYLETPGLDFIIDHLEDKDTRYKMRLRYYGPNGKFSTDEFLEVKYRENDDQKKTRIKIDTYAFTCVVGQKPLPDYIAKMNEDIPDAEFEKGVKIINQLSKQYELSPICAVEYKRLAYSNKSGSLRVTVDTNIQVSPRRSLPRMSIEPVANAGLVEDLNKYDSKFNPDTDYIVEIKYKEGGEPPDWITNMLTREDDPAKGFSKFAWGLSQCLK